MLHRKILLAIMLAVVILTGCSSGGTNPVEPEGIEYEYREPADYGGHSLWGMFDLYLDTEAMKVKAVPIREALPHYDVTQYLSPPACMDCIIFTILDFNTTTRIATVKVTIRNPFPLAGFDVRGILILNDAGHYLVYPDGWVSIFDDGLPPYFNPFMRYGKSNAYGEFPPFGELSENYKIYLPKPPQYNAIRYVIEGFRPKNGMREPYEINNEQVDGFLYDNGSNSVTLSVKVLDRNDDVASVTIECPDIFDGVKEMVSIGGGFWEISFTNEKLAPAIMEPYMITIEAHDSIVSYTLRDEYPVYIMEKIYSWMPNFAFLETSTCSHDIAGITGGAFDSGGYLVNPYDEWAAFDGYDQTFMIPIPAVDLIDLNPDNLTLQPYPPARFDSSTGGALAFSNSAEGTFQDGIHSVPLNQVVVTLHDDLVFKDDQMGDHQAHYPLGEDTVAVSDICDSFSDRFYILWAETTGDGLPVIMSYEPDYTTDAQLLSTVMPEEFIGPGDGQIINHADAILGIDAMEIESIPPSENVQLFILENDGDGAQVEVFNIYTETSTAEPEITHILTIDLPVELGDAVDLELLPPYSLYEPNPDVPSLVVLFENEMSGFPFGYLTIFDPATGVVVDEIGNADEPMVFDNIQYIDVSDGTFTILVTSETTFGNDMLMIFMFTFM